MFNIYEIIDKVVSGEYIAFFYTPGIYRDSNSYIFKKPLKIITADTEDFNKKLSKVNDYSKKQLYGFSLYSYEAGYFLEDKLKNLRQQKTSSLLFKLYFFNKENFVGIKSDKISYENVSSHLSNNTFTVNNFNLNISKARYISDIKKIKSFIAEGDTYQVNYTVKGGFNFTGSIQNLFLNMIFNQSAKYVALINDGKNIIISISPELFFLINNNTIITSPMKGTIYRGKNIDEDEKNKKELRQSEKNLSENVMIVDLMRNDLIKICKPESVKPISLFDIEKYETLYQMTSTIKGSLRTKKVSDIIKNIFPCGSITGAPKIRTMGIISGLEKKERGIYTGSIGLMLKDKAVFNVAIRTIVINKKTLKGEIGLGSGIVWDSNTYEEFKETKLKGAFLTGTNKYFELIETMLVEKGKVFLLNYHLQRLQKASCFFLFAFDKERILSEIMKMTSLLKKDEKKRLRLLLDKWGNIKIEITDLNELLKKIKVIISTKKINTNNKFQYFKTTYRKIYDKAFNFYTPKGFFDVIFLNEKGEITEGAISNIIIRKNDKFYTPPISSGILNGVYRRYLLQKNKNLSEHIISFDDLINSDELILINSVRKEVFVNELIFNDKIIKRYY